MGWGIQNWSRIWSWTSTAKVMTGVPTCNWLAIQLHLSRRKTKKEPHKRLRIWYWVSDLKRKKSFDQALNHQQITTWLTVNRFNAESNHCPTADRRQVLPLRQSCISARAFARERMSAGLEPITPQRMVASVPLRQRLVGFLRTYHKSCYWKKWLVGNVTAFGSPDRADVG